MDVGPPASIARFVYTDRDDPSASAKEVTVEEYFARIKSMRLRFPNLPVLVVGPRQRNLMIPMELLMIWDKPQKVVKELNEFQKAKLIRGTCLKPSERKRRIAYMIGGQELNEDAFLENYCVSIGDEMIHCSGRVIEPPKLELFVRFFVDLL
ncbi:unnamed protein product [Anisakis simplex]|uniref:PAZ domain-containing protein n=1 Tax=Anisakis simplex TaxID=6269 RepID=A0A0M3J8A3_ANISI|nr:unnamed protein product [Anisakis simplex]